MVGIVLGLGLELGLGQWFGLGDVWEGNVQGECPTLDVPDQLENVKHETSFSVIIMDCKSF